VRGCAARKTKPIDDLSPIGAQAYVQGMSRHHDVLVEDVDAAIDFVIRNGAQDRGQTISYSRVFEAAGLPPPQDLHFGGESQLVTLFMERFHFRCMERALPPLDSLVVHVAGQRTSFPGSGYFRINKQVDPLSERATASQQARATTFWETQKIEWGVRSRRGQA
jgi:hypothetical protein